MKMYMHTVSGDVASEQDWKDDFDAMDRESWFGVDVDECRDWHWLNNQPKLVEVVKNDDGDWVEA